MIRCIRAYLRAVVGTGRVWAARAAAGGHNSVQLGACPQAFWLGQMHCSSKMCATLCSYAECPGHSEVEAKSEGRSYPQSICTTQKAWGQPLAGGGADAMYVHVLGARIVEHDNF